MQFCKVERALSKTAYTLATRLLLNMRKKILRQLLEFILRSVKSHNLWHEWQPRFPLIFVTSISLHHIITPNLPLSKTVPGTFVFLTLICLC